eukprot:587741-Rhodomonas_salina.1
MESRPWREQGCMEAECSRGLVGVRSLDRGETRRVQVLQVHSEQQRIRVTELGENQSLATTRRKGSVARGLLSSRLHGLE